MKITNKNTILASEPNEQPARQQVEHLDKPAVRASIFQAEKTQLGEGAKLTMFPRWGLSEF